jgi:hypothetical protein
LSQTQQGIQSHTRFGFLGQLAAPDRIEHPARHCDVESLWQLDDLNFLLRAPQGAYDFHLRPKKRMVTVFNFKTQFMSIMGILCAIPSPPIALKAAWN